MVDMPSLGGAAQTQDSARPAEAWLEDLHWHKRMYRRSGFRWTGGDAVSIVTAMSGGKVDFAGADDLRQLSEIQRSIDAYAHQCRRVMARTAWRATRELGDATAVGQALELDPVHVADTTWTAAEDGDARANVARVLAGIPWANPLTHAWELKQLWRLYVAARTVVEDAVCDLVVEEFTGVAEHALIAAAAAPDRAQLCARVEQARAQRGRPGDPRRAPVQRY